MIDFLMTWIPESWQTWLASDDVRLTLTLSAGILGAFCTLYIIDTIVGAFRQIWKRG